MAASEGYDSLKRSRGFSFLETLAVVVVVGVLAAMIANPLTGMIQRIKLQNAANGMKHIIMNARLRSVANPDRPCGFVLRVHPASTVNDSVFSFLEKTPSDKLFIRGQDSLYLAPYVVNKRDKITVSIPSGYPSVVVFRGDGSASASTKIIVSLGDFADTLDVLASTGRVKVVSK